MLMSPSTKGSNTNKFEINTMITNSIQDDTGKIIDTVTPTRSGKLVDEGSTTTVPPPPNETKLPAPPKTLSQKRELIR